MNIEKKKFCCIYISSRDEIYYFDIILENNDLSKIVNKLNNDLNINYMIKKYFVDKKYGILFMDNLRVKKSNKLFISHYFNLLKYTNCKINLNYSKKLLELYNLFILNNSIDEK
jgi:hypothetical protein